MAAALRCAGLLLPLACVLSASARDHARADPVCASVDISNSNVTLAQAQAQARKELASASSHRCVNVLLGTRSFRCAEPLQLQGANDSNTNWIGGELTAGLDVPHTAWKPGNTTTPTGDSIFQVGLANLFPGATLTSGNLVGAGGHLQLLVEVRGAWRPMTFARWPNVAFEYDDEVPPVNWTTVDAVPAVNGTDCGSRCKSFRWANDTARPARWAGRNPLSNQ